MRVTNIRGLHHVGSGMVLKRKRPLTARTCFPRGLAPPSKAQLSSSEIFVVF